MPNIATVLKAEIARLARKEVKAHTSTLKRVVHSQRSQIAAMKRKLSELERRLGRATRQGKASVQAAREEPSLKLRFSPKGLAAQRRRLGISAQDVGLLLGTTGQAIYNWEQGKARPRAIHLQAIAALRKLGRRDAAAILLERKQS
jgi:DNA-binding transcriptional regulator YiaG